MVRCFAAGRVVSELDVDHHGHLVDVVGIVGLTAVVGDGVVVEIPESGIGTPQAQVEFLGEYLADLSGHLVAEGLA